MSERWSSSSPLDDDDDNDYNNHRNTTNNIILLEKYQRSQQQRRRLERSSTSSTSSFPSSSPAATPAPPQSHKLIANNNKQCRLAQETARRKRAAILARYFNHWIDHTPASAGRQHGTHPPMPNIVTDKTAVLISTRGPVALDCLRRSHFEGINLPRRKRVTCVCKTLEVTSCVCDDHAVVDVLPLALTDADDSAMHRISMVIVVLESNTCVQLSAESRVMVRKTSVLDFKNGSSVINQDEYTDAGTDHRGNQCVFVPVRCILDTNATVELYTLRVTTAREMVHMFGLSSSLPPPPPSPPLLMGQFSVGVAMADYFACGIQWHLLTSNHPFSLAPEDMEKIDVWKKCPYRQRVYEVLQKHEVNPVEEFIPTIRKFLIEETGGGGGVVVVGGTDQRQQQQQSLSPSAAHAAAAAAAAASGGAPLAAVNWTEVTTAWNILWSRIGMPCLYAMAVRWTTNTLHIDDDETEAAGLPLPDAGLLASVQQLLASLGLQSSRRHAVLSPRSHHHHASAAAAAVAIVTVDIPFLSSPPPDGDGDGNGNGSGDIITMVPGLLNWESPIFKNGGNSTSSSSSSTEANNGLSASSSSLARRIRGGKMANNNKMIRRPSSAQLQWHECVKPCKVVRATCLAPASAFYSLDTFMVMSHQCKPKTERFPSSSYPPGASTTSDYYCVPKTCYALEDAHLDAMVTVNGVVVASPQMGYDTSVRIPMLPDDTEEEEEAATEEEEEQDNGGGGAPPPPPPSPSSLLLRYPFNSGWPWMGGLPHCITNHDHDGFSLLAGGRGEGNECLDDLLLRSSPRRLILAGSSRVAVVPLQYASLAAPSQLDIMLLPMPPSSSSSSMTTTTTTTTLHEQESQKKAAAAAAVLSVPTTRVRRLNQHHHHHYYNSNNNNNVSRGLMTHLKLINGLQLVAACDTLVFVKGFGPMTLSQVEDGCRKRHNNHNNWKIGVAAFSKWNGCPSARARLREKHYCIAKRQIIDCKNQQQQQHIHPAAPPLYLQAIDEHHDVAYITGLVAGWIIRGDADALSCFSSGMGRKKKIVKKRIAAAAAPEEEVVNGEGTQTESHDEASSSSSPFFTLSVSRPEFTLLLHHNDVGNDEGHLTINWSNVNPMARTILQAKLSSGGSVGTTIIRIPVAMCVALHQLANGYVELPPGFRTMSPYRLSEFIHGVAAAHLTTTGGGGGEKEADGGSNSNNPITMNIVVSKRSLARDLQISAELCGIPAYTSDNGSSSSLYTQLTLYSSGPATTAVATTVDNGVGVAGAAARWVSIASIRTTQADNDDDENDDDNDNLAAAFAVDNNNNNAMTGSIHIDMSGVPRNNAVAVVVGGILVAPPPFSSHHHHSSFSSS